MALGVIIRSVGGFVGRRVAGQARGQSRGGHGGGSPVSVQIRVTGGDAVVSRLGRASRDIDRQTKAAMAEALARIQTDVQEKTPVDTGLLRGSVFTAQRGERANLRGTVSTTSRYAAPVEFGRRPGRMPPVSAIRTWARRHGAENRAYLIARAIGRRGTKGHFMFTHAAKRAQGYVPGIFRKHIRG